MSVGKGINIIKKETLKHKEAFELYYGLGNERSLQKVADEYGVTLKAVHQWNVSFNWQERVIQRDTEIGRKLQERNIDTILNEKANYRKIIKLAVGQIVDSMREGEMTYKIQDLDKLIRLDMYLLGENESSVKIENNHSLSDSDKEIIANLGNSMANLVDELGEV